MATTATYTSLPRGGGDSADRLARGLGWFSIALGTAEVLAPGRLAAALGMPGQKALLGAYGVREIVSGIGTLTAEDPRPWIAARVAGDALDLATLTAGLLADNPRRGAVALALAAVAGVTALDLVCREELQTDGRRIVRDYSDRSGFPRPPEEMRGAAARDFTAPGDTRIPEALRPYATVEPT